MYQSSTLNETKRCDTENAKRGETVLSGHGKKRNETKRKSVTRHITKQNETENERHGNMRNGMKRKTSDTGLRETERNGNGVKRKWWTIVSVVPCGEAHDQILAPFKFTILLFIYIFFYYLLFTMFLDFQ